MRRGASWLRAQWGMTVQTAHRRNTWSTPPPHTATCTTTRLTPAPLGDVPLTQVRSHRAQCPVAAIKLHKQQICISYYMWLNLVLDLLL